jgi:hypothetical protein
MHHHDPHHNRDESIHGNGAPVLKNTVTDNGNRPLAWIALIFAAFALGAMLWAIDEAKEAKREASIATMRVEGMTRALIAHGITNTYPHLDGEDD